MDKITELENRITELETILKSLHSNTTIPLEIGTAFRDRIGSTPLSLSSVSASAHNKTVDEAGMATYPVMNVPTGFVQVIIGTNLYTIPYF